MFETAHAIAVDGASPAHHVMRVRPVDRSEPADRCDEAFKRLAIDLADREVRLRTRL
jgi:hypothetical protein